jgi:hypothetical protein
VLDEALRAAGYDPAGLDAESYEAARHDYAAHRRITVEPGR